MPREMQWDELFWECLLRKNVVRVGACIVQITRGHARVNKKPIMEVARDFFRCCNLRSHSILLHSLGLLLNLSGIFRFWSNFQPLSLFLLLFNWLVCIVLECVAVEIFFQIPWRYLRLQSVTSLRYIVLVLLVIMGTINVYSVWRLCMEVHDCVISLQEPGQLTSPLLYLAMLTAMLHSIVLMICVPVQVIVIPLECNSDIPNINFRSRNIMLAVNLWLFVHFLYLCINYCYYSSIALFYRLFCTAWMLLYCYPDWTQHTYHQFKQCLPNWIRPFLRFVRDRLVSKVWRNLRTVIKRRTREEDKIDNGRNFGSVLWTALCNKGKLLLLLSYVLTCVSVSCLLKYYSGWDLTSVVPTFLLYLILYHDFYEDFADIFNQLLPLESDNNSCFISCSDSNSSPGTEKFEVQLPVQSSELD